MVREWRRGRKRAKMDGLLVGMMSGDEVEATAANGAGGDSGRGSCGEKGLVREWGEQEDS
jgi:hypothetical protein